MSRSLTELLLLIPDPLQPDPLSATEKTPPGRSRVSADVASADVAFGLRKLFEQLL